MQKSPIISAEELLQRFPKENLVIVDASAGKPSREQYEKEHIAGALYVDLDTQLSAVGEDPAKGGRHPLPTIEQFSKTLSGLGITPESHVVIYDDKKGGNAASRFWWMLRSVGHENVQVLNGGIEAAKRAGLPVNADKVSIVPSSYKATSWTLPLADIDEVDSVRLDKDHLVIDVRDAYRYNGESEPIDLSAGHIPGAINIPFFENLDASGLFLSSDKLKEKYLSVLEDRRSENVIVHCGSGVTACHTLLAMAHAGLEIPKLYVGSWSEWSRNQKPQAKR